MWFQKVVNLFDTTFDDINLPNFVTKKWIEVYDQSEKNYNVNNQCYLSGFSDAYIVVKGVVAVTNPNDAKINKAVVYKNIAPFTNCISKINAVQIDNAEELDVVMPMYHLQEILMMLVLLKLVMVQTKLAKMKLRLLYL